MYEFRGLPAGVYDLQVNTAGYHVFEPPVIIEPGECYGLIFEAHPTVSGWVVRYDSDNPAEDAPVAGALVWAEGADYVTQAGADGYFTLCLPPGEYTVMAATRERESPALGVCSGSVTVPTLPTPQCV